MGSNCCKYFGSSIVKKQVMGVTGLLLCGFLLTHLAGNLLIFAGPETFNFYSHKLVSNPFIYVAEAILAAIFLTHIALAVKMTIENRQARPESYFVKVKTGRGATFASSTMPITGFLILVFVIWHIVNLKFGTWYDISQNGTEMRDLYRLVIEYFSYPANVIGYVAFMVVVGIHVSHGFWSAFQSIGFSHPRYTPMLQIIGKIYAVALTVGYSAIPIYCYLQGGN